MHTSYLCEGTLHLWLHHVISCRHPYTKSHHMKLIYCFRFVSGWVVDHECHLRIQKILGHGGGLRIWDKIHDQLFLMLSLHKYSKRFVWYWYASFSIGNQAHATTLWRSGLAKIIMHHTNPINVIYSQEISWKHFLFFLFWPDSPQGQSMKWLVWKSLFPKSRYLWANCRVDIIWRAWRLKGLNQI